ncbi:hypothetical protein CHS0354_009623 [Potamilus streckersoni]|uniref:Ig-like domain-containing protein n=1 Tax=Potamilus streckersoni TaxID=2493646 RepID=A0AAE0WDC4_9BIVA|nr:hypothetical protein CHS0354_009623 [Potamilus streckersoni]
MNFIIVLTVWISLNHIVEKRDLRVVYTDTNYKCTYTSDDELFAIAGCNATLEWILEPVLSSGSIGTLTTIDVFNARGVRIAWNEDGASGIMNDSSICSNILQHGEKWLFSVVLVNVTPIHSGQYMGQITYGFLKEQNITKELIVIDKAHIVKHKKCILGEPLSITCNVGRRLEGLKYHWKLNGTDLISTGRIYTNISTLIFERVLTVDKSGILACDVCKEDACCISSGTFNLDPYCKYKQFHRFTCSMS